MWRAKLRACSLPLGLAFTSMGCGPDAAHDGGTDTDVCEELPPLLVSDEELGLPSAGDLDGDGNVDVFMYVPVFEAAPETAVLWGRGDGSFEVGSGPVFSAPSPATLELGDVLGDGRVEVVWVAGSSEGEPESAQLELSQLAAGREFEPSTSSELAGSHPYPTTTADLDGDGRRELIGSSKTDYSHMISIFASNGVFDSRVEGPPIELPWVGVRAVLPADLDGDGDDEVVVFGAGSGSPELPPTLVVADADESGALAPVAEYDVGTDPGSAAADMQVADFDGDGFVDVSVMNLQDLSVLRGRGDGTLESHVLVSFPAWVEFGNECDTCSTMRGARAGDFDGDGVAELAVLVGFVGQEEAWIIDEVLGAAPVLVPIEAWGDDIADFDGDECDDILSVVRSESLFESSVTMTLHRCPMLACAPE